MILSLHTVGRIESLRTLYSRTVVRYLEQVKELSTSQHFPGFADFAREVLSMLFVPDPNPPYDMTNVALRAEVQRHQLLWILKSQVKGPRVREEVIEACENLVNDLGSMLTRLAIDARDNAS